MKKVPENCFLCENKRVFSLTGKKESYYNKKISYLLGHPFMDFVTANKEAQIELGVCRACDGKIQSAYEIVQKLELVLSDGIQLPDSTRVKRGIVSPTTPKVSATVKHSKHSPSQTTARRSLVDTARPGTSICKDSPEVVEVPVSGGHAVLKSDHDCKDTAIGSDHDYTTVFSNTAIKPQDSHAILTNTAVDIIKQHLHDISGSTGNCGIVDEIVDIVANNKTLSKRVQARFLEQINNVCGGLASRDAALNSILLKKKSVSQLLQNGENIIPEILQEISESLPFVLDLFCTMAIAGNTPSANKIAPIVSAYAILMNARNEKLSAWHRLTTVVSIKGHLDDAALTLFNRMGLTMSSSSKLRLLGEAGDMLEHTMNSTRRKKLLEITSDRDVRPGHQAMDRHNKGSRIEPKKRIKRQAAIGRPRATSVSGTPYQMTQNSPPPKQLFTATRQSSLTQFFHAGEDSATEYFDQKAAEISSNHRAIK
ncbi:uncharacterized protein LOC127836178 isoform X2 [Dreissena polymorpha]|uniref:uncharacterized protein LOC127836178 isoform X2 n=1 Tax=Dreissena polymorpha TaxID=45954 RepID=UPI00226544B4|nr:uncharacterized protein LOC127836178 isoform X2 [Dreissena polymorpha]